MIDRSAATPCPSTAHRPTRPATYRRGRAQRERERVREGGGREKHRSRSHNPRPAEEPWSSNRISILNWRRAGRGGAETGAREISAARITIPAKGALVGGVGGRGRMRVKWGWGGDKNSIARAMSHGRPLSVI
jgi:hypothetical protein